MYIVSTDDPNETVIEYPSGLVFHTHNWDAPEHVRVQRVDDSINDGDGNFTVISIPQPLHNSPYWDYLEDVEFGPIGNNIVPTTVLTDEPSGNTNE